MIFPQGTLFVLNDNGDNLGGNLGAYGVSPTGTLIGSQLLPASEQGDILPTGVMCIPGEGTDANYAINFYFYDCLTWTLIATVAAQTNQSSLSPVRSNGTDTFYVPQLDRTLVTFNASGVQGMTTWTLPADSDDMSAGTPNATGTIYYYADHIPAATISLHRYDLTNDLALTDLFSANAPALSTIKFGNDILIGPSGHVFVVLQSTTSTWDVQERTTGGVLVRTYSDGLTSPASPPRISMIADDATAFWLMTPSPTGQSGTSVFTKFLISDGSTVTTFGVAQDPAGLTGPASSCPLLIIPVGHSTPVLGPSTHRPMRRVRQAPHLWDNANSHRLFYPGFQLLAEMGAPRADNADKLRFCLQWSDDGGNTWSNEYWIDAGTVGQYQIRAIWRRLGQSRDRVFRVLDDNNARTVLIDALLSPEPVEGSG